MKRKYGNRPNWSRVLEKEYAQTYLDTEHFKGYITLIKFIKVKEPLWVNYNDHKICIVNDGYLWLQQFPCNKHHAVTTMFDQKGEIIQWYIDVCYKNGVGIDQIPWMDDLYLDVIVLTNGEIISKDLNELDEAFHHGEIEKSLYSLAKQEAKQLISQIENNSFTLMDLSREHKDLLLPLLKKEH